MGRRKLTRKIVTHLLLLPFLIFALFPFYHMMLTSLKQDRELYDRHAVPLIIKQAGNVRAGTRVPDLVQHVDIVPTVLDLARAPVPDNLRGMSLTPLLEGTAPLPERRVYSESLYALYQFGWSALASVTDMNHVTGVVDPFATQAQAAAQGQELADAAAQIEQGREQAAQGQAQLDAAVDQAKQAGVYDSMATEFEAQQQAIDEGLAQLDAAEQQLALGTQLATNASELRAALRRLGLPLDPQA